MADMIKKNIGKNTIGEKITHRFTDKLPITNFPLKTDDSKDAPVVIYEFPIENPP